MVKVIMHGCNGHMGQVISQLAKEMESLEIVAGIDLVDNKENGYPVFTDIKECSIKADVIIDFASAKAVDGLLDYVEDTKIPLVLCTTGLSEKQLARLEEVSKDVAVLKSANMSLGINALLHLLKEAAKTLVPSGFDVEVVEKHHRLKVDAPSGTALALADSVNEGLKENYAYNFDRSKERKAREDKEIGIVAVRGGNIVGEHEVIFAGLDEVITFKHTAYSKSIFAKGALEAALYLKGKEAGYYTMADVIENK
ncbi:MAG TPA: 4-hydroxy-tetrahydrodipicolinate reductase [Lachnospiraceae bacterium]